MPNSPYSLCGRKATLNERSSEHLIQRELTPLNFDVAFLKVIGLGFNKAVTGPQIKTSLSLWIQHIVMCMVCERKRLGFVDRC